MRWKQLNSTTAHPETCGLINLVAPWLKRRCYARVRSKFEKWQLVFGTWGGEMGREMGEGKKMGEGKRGGGQVWKKAALRSEKLSERNIFIKFLSHPLEIAL